jgi:hypothetical protein
MAVEKRLRRLRRIGLQKTGVRLRQLEAEHMQLHPHAADDADALAEIDLRMARRVSERHRTSLASVTASAARSPSPPCSRRRNRARPAAARLGAGGDL